MQYALDLTALIAPWSVVGAVIGAVPGVVALFSGRKWLGAGLVAAAVLPVAWGLWRIYSDLLRIAETYPPDSIVRQAPWGGMGGLLVLMPLAWGAFMLLVGAILVAALSFRGRSRCGSEAADPTMQ